MRQSFSLYWYVILVLLFQNHLVKADTISTPHIIDNNDVSMAAPAFPVFNSATNKFFVGWISDSLYYSLYTTDGTLSSGPNLLVENGDVVSPFTLPITSYNSTSNQFLASYMGSSESTQRTWYNILDQNGTIMSGPNPTNNVADNESNSLVWSCYNSTDNVYAMAWGSTNNLGFFSIINADGTIAKNSTAISTCSVDANGGYNVAVSYNSSNNRYLFTWQDADDSTPCYAIYASNSNNPTLVAAGTLDGSDLTSPIVASCYNSTANVWFITWTDTANKGYFTTIDPSGNIITSTRQFSANVGQTNLAGITSSYNEQNDEYLLTWESADNKVMYGTCKLGTTTTITTAILDDTLASNVYGSVFHAYSNGNTNKSFITWIKLTPQNGYYATFARYLPTLTYLKAERVLNRFALYGEYFNRLTWVPTSLNNLASYKVYRNDTLISTLPTTQTTYEDHNQPNIVANYSIKAINTYGAQTEPLTISI